METDKRAVTVSEFEIIDRLFRRDSGFRPDVELGVGDDCALLRVPADRLLAVTMDTLVEGIHFPAGADARGLGHKALAVNLSDLAAMGATPAWLTLSLSLPAVDRSWLDRFMAGFYALAEVHGAALVGGDTSRGGVLSCTVQAHGFLPLGGGLRRGGARPGDAVVVTGTFGDAGLGLAVAQGRQNASEEAGTYLRGRLERPTPRVSAGVRLLSLANAAIDVSDGLAQDLGHVLRASGVGATIFADAVPLSEAMLDTLEVEDAQRIALTAGDDYELCFTCCRDNLDAVFKELADCGTRATEIGVIDAEPGLRVAGGSGAVESSSLAGYRHF